MSLSWQAFLLVAVTAMATADSDTLYFQPSSTDNDAPGLPGAGSVLCPDKQGTCPNGETCCKNSLGKYSCCPLPKAVCCSDHRHCCPSGHTCNIPMASCDPAGDGGAAIPWVSKRPATPVGSVLCPGGKYYCPDGSTCCKLESGEWGCCPLPKAACCADGIHCCPNGYKCDPGTSSCRKGTVTLTMKPMAAATELEDMQMSTVTCPDKESTCPEDTTCCKMQSGWYGCCPKKNAVCCSDHLHCCNEGETCDVEHGLCKKGDQSSPLGTKFPATPAPPVTDVTCPDHKSICPSGETCCPLESGQYGCCALPKAVCCSDHLHCCPEGYTCDLAHQSCHLGDSIVPMLKKMPAKQVEATVCPGGEFVCPSRSTCCKVKGGEYRCCQFPKATCCSDKIHCCPEDTTCDHEHKRCVGNNNVTPWMEKVPASRQLSVICPDHSTCADGTTCCEIDSGVYGCCPYPKAVCCTDHVHCCPEGHTCDVESQSCKQDGVSIASLIKMDSTMDSRSQVSQVSPVICPGGKEMCPSGMTCCENSNGDYLCCPFPQAVCCGDKDHHCCPHGFTCDVKEGLCTKSEVTVSVPWSEKVPARPAGSFSNDVVCPDGQHCSDGNTCCLMASGQYGCCPYSQAVCCSDNLHCCPYGTKCDTEHQKCTSVSDSLEISWDDVKHPSVMPRYQAVKCKDGTECPWGSTCCMQDGGKYGCCPMPEATCCPDHIHCCPKDYECDDAKATCVKEGSSLTVAMTLHSRSRSRPPAEQNGVVCPDGKVTCPDGMTCCKMPSGLYGCCPLEDAVCCKDHIHCCPRATQCTATGKCVQGVPFLTKLPAAKLGLGPDGLATFPDSVLCPDRSHQCPDFETCCKMQSGSWGCCPLQKAVCCSNGQYCCPQGYHCHEDICIKDSRQPSGTDEDEGDSMDEVMPAFLLSDSQTLH